MDQNPYVEQSIEIMKHDQAGSGVKIVYDNSGIGSGTTSWNQFMDGLSDPNVDFDEDEEDTVISEPPLGVIGSITELDLLINQFFHWVEMHRRGDTVQVSKTLLPTSVMYQSLSSCDDTALNEAISV